jgi:lipopolysaccharide transport system permease protein
MPPTSSLSPDTTPAEAWVIAANAEPGLRDRLAELWRYRRIIWFFGLRAVTKLYAKTKLGWPWLIIRPLAPIAVGSLVYGRVMQVDTAPFPYFLFLTVATAAWNFFDSPLTRASRGLEVNRELIRKLYLPRMILPITQIFAGLVEPLICVAVMIGAVFYYHSTTGVWYAALGPRVLGAVAAALVAVGLAAGCGLWTSIWQARARDTKFILAYVLSFWYFLTPIIYPLSALPPAFRTLAILNPMTGPVETFKWGVLGIEPFPSAALTVSIVVVAAVLAGGMWYFPRVEAATTDQL